MSAGAHDNVERLRTDAVMAQDIRETLEPLVTKICQIMDDAKRHGLIVSFNIASDQYGRTKVVEINIVRPL